MTQNNVSLGRWAAAALFTAVMAGTWDAWWHGAIGRESFWLPPHLLLYSSVLAAVGFGVYGWWRAKDRLWRSLALALLLIPASAPFDELWHRMFGVESISSPLIVWSPPHLILVGVIIWSFIRLLPVLGQDNGVQARAFFTAMAFAGIASLLIFLTTPFVPTGPHKLLGFWGAGITCVLFIATLLFAERSIPHVAAASLVAVFIILLHAIGVGEGMTPNIDVPPHGHPPSWLNVFSFLAPAAFLDASRKWPILARSIVASAACCGILYGFASYFMPPEFTYSWRDAATAILSSVIFGAALGAVMRYGWGRRQAVR